MTAPTNPCEACRWFRSGADLPQPGDMCAHRSTVYIRPEFNRAQPTSCGPSGRYFEPIATGAQP